MKKVFLLLTLWLATPLAVAQTQITSIEVGDNSIGVDIIHAKMAGNTVDVSKARLLWLPSEYGVLSQEKQLARQLSEYGIESWFTELYEAMFLSPTASAVDKVSTDWLNKIIDVAYQSAQEAGQPLWIVAPNKAAQLAVRGLASFQQTPKNDIGLILLNPNLYLNTPNPGEEAQYWSQVSAINAPVSILQAEQSPWRWRVMDLANQLQTSGSDVFVQVQQKARDRFYFRPDALEIEKEITTHLADKLRWMMKLQLPYLAESRQAEKQAGLLTLQAENKVAETRSVALQPFTGEQGRVLELVNLQGDKVALTDYKGQVVLLNFWASWCPPCVHEMPSMARLNTQLADQPFEILAVNLAEQRSAIQAFTDDHPVNFPILLDPTGSAVKTWQVFAYPSTYLIDKQGQIRSVLYGGTEWDEAHHVEKIEALLNE